MKTWNKGKLAQIMAPESRMGQMGMKCMKYLYMGQGFSGEQCGPLASCSIFCFIYQCLTAPF
jgi:hypothetical protein